MEFPLNASFINDFIFCPYSIFIHNMYENMPNEIFQNEEQISGTFSHQMDLRGKKKFE